MLLWQLGMVKRLPERELDRGAQTTDGYEVRFLTSYNICGGQELQLKDRNVLLGCFNSNQSTR